MEKENCITSEPVWKKMELQKILSMAVEDAGAEPGCRSWKRSGDRET